jgi:TatD DNase family protein
LDIIDTHAHLDMSDFESDRIDVIKRAGDSGVKTIITIGIDLESDNKAIKLAENYSGIWAAVGIHPQESKDVQQCDMEKLYELANHKKVVAIGEIGLDYYRDYAPHNIQKQVLEWELEIAKKNSLPIIIHCRQAQEDILPILRSWCDSYNIPDARPRGVIHCFSGDKKIAEQYIKMGFYISIGAYTGYPSSATLRNVIKDIPLDRLVVETDCPFLPPQKLRGKRNEPAYVVKALEVLAEVKQLTLAEVSEKTTENAYKIFGLGKQCEMNPVDKPNKQ